MDAIADGKKKTYNELATCGSHSRSLASHRNRMPGQQMGEPVQLSPRRVGTFNCNGVLRKKVNQK